MSKLLTILDANRLNEQSIAVGFSDGTGAVYTVEQLAALIPTREHTVEQTSQSCEPFDGDNGA